jgi:hypothetical protein
MLLRTQGACLCRTSGENATVCNKYYCPMGIHAELPSDSIKWLGLRQCRKEETSFGTMTDTHQTRFVRINTSSGRTQWRSPSHRAAWI